MRENYRPISLLPVWGKILDKVITNILMSYFETNKILDNLQVGFRKNNSIIDALNFVKNFIDGKLGEKQVVCMISLDIKNAFNSIHRNDILEIMDNYRVPTKEKLLIVDYLKNRKIKVSENEYLDFNIGVPQGSSLGPTLWLLIINELLEVEVTRRNRGNKLIAYADEIVRLMNSTASFRFTNNFKEPIKDIIDWCEKYHLNLSIPKCTFTMFKLRGGGSRTLLELRLGTIM